MKIKHLLSDPLKISLFETDEQFITFVKEIALENDDTDTVILTKEDAINYINEFCEELVII